MLHHLRAKTTEEIFPSRKYSHMLFLLEARDDWVRSADLVRTMNGRSSREDADMDKIIRSLDRKIARGGGPTYDELCSVVNGVRGRVPDSDHADEIAHAIFQHCTLVMQRLK